MRTESTASDKQSSDSEEIERMKNRLCSLFHRGNRTMATAEAKRKLILHFDVNKTIVPVDSATGETVEAALNVFLSGMAWGKDREGVWHAKETLSNSPLEVDDVSFYKFEEKRLLKEITQDRATLRCHLTSFTDKPQGSNFKPYLNTLLNSLKWTLPYDENIHKQMTVPGTKYSRFHFILPAFYNLLRYLVDEGREFAVVFRTYGSDARSVLTSIKRAIQHEMPFCENLACLSNNISSDVYSLRRDSNLGDRFTVSLTGSGSTQASVSGDTKCFSSDGLSNEDMYDWFTNMTGINAIQDNVEDWYMHGFDSCKGKPLWIDHADDSSHHVFFDDNIRPGNMDSIVNLRLRKTDADGVQTFSDVQREDERSFDHTNIVPVSFPEAILDDQYFISRLNLCEANYSVRTQKFCES